jgi:hypothetical protein
MGLSLDEYQELLGKVRGTQLIYLEDMSGDEGDRTSSTATWPTSDPQPARATAGPPHALGPGRRDQELLPEREQYVMSMYYEHDMNLKEIAAVLGSPSPRLPAAQPVDRPAAGQAARTWSSESVVLILLALRARADFATAEELMRIVEQIQGDNGTINLNASHLAVKGRVSRKLVDALQHIETAIQQVHRSSDAIRQASGDIAHGNQLLSSRTEDAAASIAQTAASVEEIASTIRASVDNAHQANQLAGQASDVATRGGEAVHRVVDTMSGIQQSSRKITDIIGQPMRPSSRYSISAFCTCMRFSASSHTTDCGPSITSARPPRRGARAGSA